MPDQAVWRKIIGEIIAMLFIAFVLHMAFSWMGFNPTDDGFTLAYSRRILDGQIPHRDFIIIRPFLSPLIHTPELFFGDYTYWVSRFFVWLQFTIIAWLWTFILLRAFKIQVDYKIRLALTLISIAASVQVFPIMAWHTIDGIFFITIGLSLRLTSQQKSIQWLGYIIMGMAYLCKQSFIFFVPATIFILRDWRAVRFWLAYLLPGIIYLLYVVAFGALPNAFAQLGSQTGLFDVGIKVYFERMTPFGIITGYILACLTFSESPNFLTRLSLPRWLCALVLSGGPLFLAILALTSGRLIRLPFELFGVLIGLGIYKILTKNNPISLHSLLLTLMFAWSLSLSIGYNTPAFALGQMLVILIVMTYRILNTANASYLRHGLIVASCLILVAFGIGRINNIYRDQSVSHLTISLDGILPGGKFIYTNHNTYAFLVDLNLAIGQIQGQGIKYAIIPDNAGFWVQALQINPLPIDWAQQTELSTRDLEQIVINKFEHGKIMIIVQRVQAATLANGFIPLDENAYAIVAYVRTHFNQVKKTEFFDIYE